MEKKSNAQTNTSRPVYTKPEITKEEKMNFMYAALKNASSKIACRQCSSCHACR